MNHQHRYAALAAAIVLAWGTAGAQSPAQPERTEDFSTSLRHADYLKGADLRASEIVGARVRNAAGESLGKIEELIVPSRDEDDMLVIVSLGGALDLDDKLVALPYNDLRVSADGDTFYYDLTETQLKAEHAFKYGTQAAARKAPSAAPKANTANVVLDVFDYRASDLVGAKVLDDRGETVGNVDDIVLSTDDHKLHAVVAIGGFLGFGEKLISMPFEDLQITSDDGDPRVRIPMTGERLNQLVDSRSLFRYERQVAKSEDAPRG